MEDGNTYTLSELKNNPQKHILMHVDLTSPCFDYEHGQMPHPNILGTRLFVVCRFG